MDVKEFNNGLDIYGSLTAQQLQHLKYNFIVEFENIKIKQEDSKTL